MSIRITNSFTDPKEKIIEKIINIRVLTSSQEIKYLNLLTKHDRGYFDEELEKKLFNAYESNTVSGDKSFSDLYLKNKYLYLTTRGVLNYLELYESFKESENSEYYKFEIENVERILIERLEKKEISLISLGAAHSDKEISALKNIDPKLLKRLDYNPVDVSDFLIHLGIIDSGKVTDFEIKSIIADFWDLAKYIKSQPNKREELFGKKPKLFAMLGGTFGNYTEKELLDQIMSMMVVEDELLISVQFYNDIKTIKNTLIDEYKDTPGNSGFLLEPLTYIPFYYGYVRYRKDLLKLDETTIVEEGDPEKEFISIVPNSICHSPYVELPKSKFCAEKKVRLAWTTRYKYEDLFEWIENYVYEDYKFEIIKNKKNRIEFIVKDYNPTKAKYGILHLKKICVDKFQAIMDILLKQYKDEKYKELLNKYSEHITSNKENKELLLSIYKALVKDPGFKIIT